MAWADVAIVIPNTNDNVAIATLSFVCMEPP